MWLRCLTATQHSCLLLQCTLQLLFARCRHLPAQVCSPSQIVTRHFSTGQPGRATGASSSQAFSDAQTYAAADDDRHRRGFGGKVALPAEDVLRQVVVSADEPVDVTLQAYHVGSRVHIGQVLSHLRRALPSCRTTSGKDYAIIWLHAVETDDVQPSHVAGDKGLGKYGQFTKYVQELLEARMKARPAAASKDRQGTHGGQQQDSVSSIAAAEKQQQLSEKIYLPRYPLMKQPPQQHKQQQVQKPLPPPVRPVAASLKAAANHVTVSTDGHVTVSTGLGQAEPIWQPPLMAVYRSGSVVFMGMEDRAEHTRLMWLNRLVPPAVRYTREERSPWMRQGRHAPSVACMEVHKVVVDPHCSGEAVQGKDELHLRVLDVGGVRVLTSVLAQSAALRVYEDSVQRSLEHLAEWRAAQSSSPTPRAGLGLSSVLAQQQDKVLFKVIAASALVINEAQQLLDVAEPAWQYDTYNKIWELMAKDHELQARLEALEAKLHQVETEAKHDVKSRAGRRTRKLEQGLVWLLVVSCILVALEVGRKAALLRANYSSAAGVVEGSEPHSAAGIAEAAVGAKQPSVGRG